MKRFLQLAACFMCVLSGSTAWGGHISQCGTYVAEGFLTRGEGQQSVLILDQDTLSETKILLSMKSAPLAERLLGTVIRVKFRVERACFDRCSAELVAIQGQLDPFERPQGFLTPETSPIEKINCK